MKSFADMTSKIILPKRLPSKLAKLSFQMKASGLLSL